MYSFLFITIFILRFYSIISKKGGNEMEFLKEIFMFIGHLILLGLIFIPGIYILSLIVKILRNNTRK